MSNQGVTSRLWPTSWWGRWPRRSGAGAGPRLGGVDVLCWKTRVAASPRAMKCNHVAARTMRCSDVSVLQPRCARPACRLTIPTTSPTARPFWAPSSRVFRYLAAPTATARPVDPTPGGRRPSRRTGSIRSISSGAIRASGSPALASASATARRCRSSSRARIRHRASDRPQFRQDIEIACKFMVGCDGGNSMVRKAIGASLAVIPSCRGCSRPISARPICYRCCARGAARRHGHPSP